MQPFPAAAFEEALEFATAIFQFGSGQPVRRLALFDHPQKAPESGVSTDFALDGMPATNEAAPRVSRGTTEPRELITAERAQLEATDRPDVKPENFSKT